MIDAFVRCVLDNGENISDGDFSLNVTKTMDAIQRSIAASGIPQEI